MNGETNQNTKCSAVGADSSVSDSCNQQSTINVNNGVPRTAAKSEPTGTLLVNEVCSGIAACFNSRVNEFGITITGNSPQPSSFSFIGSGSQLVTLGTGGFVITQSIAPNASDTLFEGDCMGTSDVQATGTISAGQQLTCTIRNIGLF